MAEQPKLLDRMRSAIRARHYSTRTEETYVGWIKRFILFHKKRHPSAMGADEVNEFLTSLAADAHVSAATQNQALSAILFLYRVVLEDPLPWITDLIRAKRSEHVPVVLTPSEARTVIDELGGVSRLVAQLLYGSGLRLLECLRLRVKEIDFARHELLVRDPKGGRDRVTTLLTVHLIVPVFELPYLAKGAFEVLVLGCLAPGVACRYSAKEFSGGRQRGALQLQLSSGSWSRPHLGCSCQILRRTPTLARPGFGFARPLLTKSRVRTYLLVPT